MNYFISRFIFLIIGLSTYSNLYCQELWQRTTLDSTLTILSINTNSKKHIFVSTNYYTFRSTDGGNNWIMMTPTNVLCSAINSQDYIFMGDEKGRIFRSTDDGVTWTDITNGLNLFRVNSLNVNSSDYIFVGGKIGKGFYLSTDNGDTWIRRANGLPDTSVSIIVVHPNGDIYDYNLSTTCIYGGYYIDIYKSTNNGENWSPKYTCAWAFSATVAPNGYLFHAGWRGVWRSTDEGNTWNAVNNDGISTGLRSITAAPDGKIYIGDDGRVYSKIVWRSTNYGANWSDFGRGLPLNIVYTLKVGTDGYLYAGLVAGGLYRTINTVTSVKNEPAPNEINFSLEQNYPNPFNSITKIKYKIGKASRVVIKVYDIIGREISTLVNEDKQPGEYETQLVIRNEQLTSGCYFYELKANEVVLRKKMVLLK